MRDHTTDEALIHAWRSGDEGAFTVLFHRYNDRVTAYAWRMISRREEAEEIAVEAFERVLRGAWRPGGSFRSFLFTVVHRLCLDRIRRRGRALRGDVRIADEGAPWVANPEEAAEIADERSQMEQALARLPEAHRAVLLLYYGQDLSSREVSEILDCDDQQVRSRLSYARRLLRQELEGAAKVES